MKGFVKQKRILGQVRKAVEDYDMIAEGDRIVLHY